MTISELLSLSFAAILGENLVLTRLFGVDALGKDIKNTALVGGALVPTMALSCGVSSLVFNSVLVPARLEHLQIVVFVAIAAAIAKVMELLFGAVFGKTVGLFPLLALNGALLGAMLTGVGEGLSLVGSLIYGALAALGFDLALFVYHGVKEKLRLASPNGAFQGAPLAFIAIGLVIMAFMGFGEVEISAVLDVPFKMAG